MDKKKTKRLLKKKRQQQEKTRKYYDDPYIVDLHNNGVNYLVLSPKTMPKEINHWRKTQAVMSTRLKASKPTSRMNLYDFKNNYVKISGLVSDIIVDFDHADDIKHSNSRILIENPTLEMVYNEFGKTDYFKLIDSHIWVNLSDIAYCNERFNSQYVSIGDIIYISAKIIEYQGLGDYGLRGAKYGLSEVQIAESGMYVEELKTGDALIRSDYPRGKDWIIHLNRHIPKDNEIGYLIEHMTVKPSLYPSYRERMNL